ncbi:MAG: hypothetical protein LBU27_08645 [Candidatus Peribacteria bacterium]|nr:hypothetical protein [Candidatus Peribacteria bacterium]
METSSEQNNTASKKHRNRKHLGTSLALTGALTFGAGNATAQTTTTDTVPKSDTPERVLPTDTVTIQSSETKQKAESPNGAFLNLYQ